MEQARSGKPAVEPDGQPRPSRAAHSHAPCWPEICAAVVAFQRGQGVNMNLVGPFKGKGYFCLLPADRAATEADVRRFALHSSESLKARLDDPTAPLIPMATHRQGFRQKREVVSSAAPRRLRGDCSGEPERGAQGNGEPQEGSAGGRR